MCTWLQLPTNSNPTRPSSLALCIDQPLIGFTHSAWSMSWGQLTSFDLGHNKIYCESHHGGRKGYESHQQAVDRVWISLPLLCWGLIMPTSFPRLFALGCLFIVLWDLKYAQTFPLWREVYNYGMSVALTLAWRPPFPAAIGIYVNPLLVSDCDFVCPHTLGLYGCVSAAVTHCVYTIRQCYGPLA